MLDTFTMSTFNENDVFKVYYEEEKFVELTLFKITEGKYKIQNAPRQPFLLLFKGSKEGMLSQGLYKMIHEKVGTFDMFIAPTVAPYGEQDNAYFYEAVFS